MALRPERVLAIDVARQTVRGIVLATGTPAVAGGYAQLDFEPAAGPVAFAVRIASALDVKMALPVAVTCGASIEDAVAEEIAAAIVEAGFAAVTVVQRTEAHIRSAAEDSDSETLDGVDIPSGLLTSHAGLTLSDLAAVVGVGLRLLGDGSDTDPGDQVVPVEVWSPTTDTAPITDTDPFTADPFTADSSDDAKAGVVAAGAGAVGVGAAAAIAGHADDTAQVFNESSSAGPDGVPATELVSDDDATVNPDDVPAATVAASEPLDEVGLDETVVIDREALRQTAAAALAGAPAVAAAETAEAAPPAAALATETQSTSADNGDSTTGSKRLILMLVAAVALVALVGLFFTQCGGNGSAADSTDADPLVVDNQPDAEASLAPLVSDQPTAEPDPTPLPDPTAVPAAPAAAAVTAAPEPTPEPEPTAEPEPTVDPLAGLPPLSTLPERGAIFRPPTLFLEGPVQTQEQADELYERAIAVVGPDNVVNNYIVRPDAPAALDGNVRVEQAVLFQTGSAAIADEFVPTLELGVAVMALNPQVQMVVEGHTDSVGSDASNIELSQRRAEAVVAYLVSRGVDPQRLEADGQGEATPVADNDTAEGRQTNRRIEVNLLDLLAAE